MKGRSFIHIHILYLYPLVTEQHGVVHGKSTPLEDLLQSLSTITPDEEGTVGARRRMANRLESTEFVDIVLNSGHRFHSWPSIAIVCNRSLPATLRFL